MYNTITVINERSCTNRTINYKFTLVFDKQSNTTMAVLQLYKEQYVKKYAGEFFFQVVNKIQQIFDLPYDPENKVYNGPELSIKLYDDEKPYEWVNLSHTLCDFDKAFFTPNFYVDGNTQKIYEEIVYFLIKVSDNIFGNMVN